MLKLLCKNTSGSKTQSQMIKGLYKASAYYSFSVAIRGHLTLRLMKPGKLVISSWIHFKNMRTDDKVVKLVSRY